MCKRTYILGAIYIIGNGVYVNCMCNREIDDITLNSWFYQLYHGCDISFSLCSFSFLQRTKNMDIIIRNIDRDIVDRINELAKKKGKSRNEFLKDQVKQLALHPEITEKEDQYKRLVKEIAVVIQQNTQVLNELLLQED